MLSLILSLPLVSALVLSLVLSLSVVSTLVLSLALSDVSVLVLIDMMEAMPPIGI